MNNPKVFYGFCGAFVGCLLAVVGIEKFDSTLLLMVGGAMILTGAVLMALGGLENLREAKEKHRVLEASAMNRFGDEDLNHRIKKQRRKITFCWIAMGGAFVLLCVLASMELATGPVIIGTFAAMFGLFLLQAEFGKGLKNCVSDDILQQVLDAYFTEVEYDVEGRIGEEWIRNSDMWLPEFEASSGDDLIKAKYNGLGFELSDINLKRWVKHWDEDGKENHSWESVFRGFMLMCKLNAELPADVRLCPSYRIGIGGVFRTDMKFDKKFHVEADDEPAAAWILTPAVTEKLEAMKKPGVHMHLERNGQVRVAISTGKDAFEVGVGKQLDAGMMRRRFHEELECVLETLDVLLLIDHRAKELRG